jgi:hypothetical protein
MKTVALAVVTTAVLAGQSGAASITGSWIAQFEGRTFLRLELKTVEGTVAGSMSLGDIEVNEQGGLRRVAEPRHGPSPIFDATESASTVTFSVKSGPDTGRFELRLLETGEAELKILLDDADREELAANGVPIPKPIRLTKQ